jgi:transcriptional regulator with XRE-family HTH domain
MAQCRRPLPEEDRRILRAMARPLALRISQYGWTQAALAERLRARQAQVGGRLGSDRSRVSRALSGEELPARRLIEEIAMIIDQHAVKIGLPNRPLKAETMARWKHADSLRRRRAAELVQIAPRIRAVPAEGAPPAEMYTYADLLQALNALVITCFGSQRAMCRIHTNLVRPTVSAALRDRNSLSEAMLDSILRACGVRGQDRQEWLDAWFRLGLARQTHARERQLEGYRQRTGRRAWQ